MKKLVLCSMILASAAQAESFDYANRWGVGGSVGYGTPIFGNHFNKAADSGETWGLHLRYHMNSAYGLEAAFTRYEFEDTTIAAQVTDLTFFKRLMPTSRFTPVIGAGIGAVDLTNYEPNSLKLGLKLRGGVEYALNQAWSLGLNVDYQHVNKMLFGANLPTRNAHVLAARVGLTWYFGGGAATSEAKKEEQPVAKSVVDTRDTDGDGVVDSKDKCPNTKAGSKVNAYGCAIEEKATVKVNVQFDTGKTTIAQGYTDNLKELADFMSEHKNTKVEIQGHTDSSGSKAINDKLSQARAESVRNYLVNTLKVDANRISAKGYGSSQPVADNATVEGRQENRRVVAVINE